MSSRKERAALKRLKDSIDRAEQAEEEAPQPPPSAMQNRLQKAQKSRQFSNNIVNAISSMSPADLAKIATAMAPAMIVATAVVGIGYAVDNERDNATQDQAIEEKQDSIPGIDDLDFTDIDQEDLDALEVLPELIEEIGETLNDLKLADADGELAQQELEDAIEESGATTIDIAELRAEVVAVAASIPAPTDLSGVHARLAELDTITGTLDSDKADAEATSQAITDQGIAISKSLDALAVENAALTTSLSKLESATSDLTEATTNLKAVSEAARMTREILDIATANNSLLLAGTEVDLTQLQTDAAIADAKLTAAQDVADAAKADAATAQATANMAVASAGSAKDVADKAVLDAATAQAASVVNADALTATAQQIVDVRSLFWLDIVESFAEGQPAVLTRTDGHPCGSGFIRDGTTNIAVHRTTNNIGQLNGPHSPLGCAKWVAETPEFPAACTVDGLIALDWTIPPRQWAETDGLFSAGSVSNNNYGKNETFGFNQGTLIGPQFVRGWRTNGFNFLGTEFIQTASANSASSGTLGSDPRVEFRFDDPSATITATVECGIQ